MAKTQLFITTEKDFANDIKETAKKLGLPQNGLIKMAYVEFKKTRGIS